MMINRLRFVMLFSALFFIANANSEGYVRPPSGVDVNETRHIKQLKAPQSDCVSAEYPSAFVFISKEKLVAIAANPKSDDDDRAKKALSLITNSKDQWGCEVMTLKNFAEFDYLVFSLIEEGQAAIYDKGTKEFVDSAEINYFGMVCGDLCGRGDFSVILPSAPLFFLPWWVS
jgi:hypothetical protein